MNCPKCGKDIGDKHLCECGWTDIEVNDVENKNDNEETNADLKSLENINVDFDEVNGVDNEVEDEVSASPDDLVIDFDTINEKTDKNPSKKSGSNFLVALVSFIAGVLATLVVVGCLNGTIINYFDKFSNGTPYEVIESFCKSNFETNDAKAFTKASSPYYRAQIASAIKQQSSYYGTQVDVNLDVDVTKDSEFEKIADYFMKNYVVSDTQKMIINKIDYSGIEYYKSGSDEFKNYLNEYKSSSDENVAKAKGVSLFAKVNCSISYTVKTIEQQTTTTVAPETTTVKNNKKDDKSKDETVAETTTEPTTETTQAESTTSNTKSSKENCTIICVKINDNWYVYNGISTESN